MYWLFAKAARDSERLEERSTANPALLSPNFRSARFRLSSTTAIACAQVRYGGAKFARLYHHKNNLPMPRDSHMLQNVTPNSAPSQLHEHF
jgi:hypothetical protein